jgi:hypothetical protein
MIGEDPTYRKSGAGILLAWEAIRYSKIELGVKRFNFEGSMVESVEEVRRSFGALQTPYFELNKDNRSKIRKIGSCIKRHIYG